MRPSKYSCLRRVRITVGQVLDLLISVENLKGSFKHSEATLPGHIPVKLQNAAVVASYCNSPEDLIHINSLIDECLRYFDFVLLINTGKVSPSNRSNVLVIPRVNRGRDLASYSFALKLLSGHNLEELILINDSVYWFPTSIDKVVSQAD